MILTTSHPVGFDITRDKLDLSKSTNLDLDFDYEKNFHRAYNWLFNKLGHREFIWCYPGIEKGYTNHGNEYMLWVLDVPDDQCTAISSYTWNCVINKWPHVDEKLIENISDDDYEKLIDSFKGKEDQTWDKNLFNKEEHMEVLIKSPVPEKFVVDKKWICDYDLKKFDDGIISNLYREKERFEYEKLIYESGLKGRGIKYSQKIETHEDGSITLKMEWDV